MTARLHLVPGLGYLLVNIDSELLFTIPIDKLIDNNSQCPLHYK